MPIQEPGEKRTVVFIDGQNLYHNTHEAFGVPCPNYGEGRQKRQVFRNDLVEARAKMPGRWLMDFMQSVTGRNGHRKR